MKPKALTAAQIDTLAQRLFDTPIEPATSAKKAGDTFARLLAARIGAERAALAFSSIMTAETFDQAEARLTLLLDYGNPDPADEPITAAEEEPKTAPAPDVGKRKAIVDQAQTSTLPPAPDFSKPTHARFRAKLAQIVAWDRSTAWGALFAEADSTRCQSWQRRGRMRWKISIEGSDEITIIADRAAVTAAITSPWSNGQTEGQITKLKLVKRQMYGGANLDLLRARLVGMA